MDLIFSDCYLLCNVYLCIECREQKKEDVYKYVRIVCVGAEVLAICVL